MTIRTIRVTPTITAGAYSAGDAVGQRMPISLPLGSLGKTGKLISVHVVDKGNVKAAIDLFLFRDIFTAVADNAAFDISDADLVAKFAGLVKIGTGDYISLADNAVGVVDGLDIPVTFPANKGTLYFQGMAVGTPTYASTSDLTFIFAFKY